MVSCPERGCLLVLTLKPEVPAEYSKQKEKEADSMSGKGGIIRELRQSKTLLLMIAPTIVFFIVFSYIPMIGVYYAFTKFDFDGGCLKASLSGWRISISCLRQEYCGI